jgi:transcriptional regulator with XRE-family HTH domain
MSHTKAEQEKFIELRARGLSFEKIASEIGVSKPTLIKWAGELHKEIANHEYIDLQALLDQHKLCKRGKIESIARQLEKVTAEIEARDLSGETLKDLLSMKKELEESLAKQAATCSAFTGHTESKDNWGFGETIEHVLPLN